MGRSRKPVAPTPAGASSAPADLLAAAELRKLPNVGPATAGDLLRLGIRKKEDLLGRDPDALYDELCRVDGADHDPCVRDVFAALVAFAGGGPPLPWWAFTPARKARARAAGASGKNRGRVNGR